MIKNQEKRFESACEIILFKECVIENEFKDEVVFEKWHSNKGLEIFGMHWTEIASISLTTFTCVSFSLVCV